MRICTREKRPAVKALLHEPSEDQLRVTPIRSVSLRYRAMSGFVCVRITVAEQAGWNRVRTSLVLLFVMQGIFYLQEIIESNCFWERRYNMEKVKETAKKLFLGETTVNKRDLWL